MITIEVVRINGKLIGRRFQDCWNLDWLSRPAYGQPAYDLATVNTPAQAAAFRKLLKENGFNFRVLTKTRTLADVTEADLRAFKAA